jgi:membrane fusion protein, heavy metal efflux system
MSQISLHAWRRARRRILGVIALVALGACSESKPEPEHAIPATAASQQPSPSSADNKVDQDQGDAPADVELQTVAMTAESAPIRLAGEVVENANATILITPRVPALVLQRHAQLGDEVVAGAALVSLSSPDVADAQATLQLAEQEWQRMRSLGRDLVSGRRYGEAQIAVEQARAKARAYGLPGSAPGRASGEFTLTAPHAGRLTEDAFIVGQRIEPGQTLFRLVDESKVWVDARIDPEMARQIPVGTSAKIAIGNDELAGKVILSGHRTAEDTRTSLVRIEVVNEHDRLHAGDLVEALIAEAAQSPQLLVPTVALTLLKGQTVAFRLDADGSLQAVPVEIGESIGSRTAVLGGLAAGDRIAVSGLYELKSRLLRSQLGDDD